jgi:hypothetical protein
MLSLFCFQLLMFGCFSLLSISGISRRMAKGCRVHFVASNNSTMLEFVTKCELIAII